MSNTESGIIATSNNIVDSTAGTGFHNLKRISISANSVITKAQRNGKTWILKSVPSDADNYLMRVELLKKEYSILLMLNHPSIPQVIELTNDEKLGTTIVMEYVDGIRLTALKRLSKNEKKHIINNLLDGVEYIHNKQIVHRDLKPDNILITHNGQNLKIIDFGFADTDTHNILKQPAGTIKYVSPEQREIPLPDVRNDIYSLGIMFSEMNIGWNYNHIIKRMTTSLDKRYKNISDIKAAFTRASRVPYFIASVIFLSILLSAGTISMASLQHQQAKLTEQEQKILSQGKTIERQAKNIKAQNQKISQQTTQLEELIQVKAEQEKVDSTFAAGKSEIDTYMVKVNFKHYTSRSSPMSLEEVDQYLKIIRHTYDIIYAFVKKQDLEEDKKAQLRIFLEQYFAQEHLQPTSKND